jgi:hypothetical protein
MLRRRGPAGLDAMEREEQRPRRDKKGITNIGEIKLCETGFRKPVYSIGGG